MHGKILKKEIIIRLSVFFGQLLSDSLVVFLVGLVTEHYTGMGKGPVNSIVRQSSTGAATNIIAGLGVGMMSTAIPIIIIAISIIGAFEFGGLYGIAIAAVGMLSNLGNSTGR